MANAVTKLTITQEACDRLIAAATAKAIEINVPMVIAIVDDAGNLKSFRRIDGAPLLSVEIPTNKAYTSAAFGIPTHGWHAVINDDAPVLNGLVHPTRLVGFRGGYPVSVAVQQVGETGAAVRQYETDMVVSTRIISGNNMLEQIKRRG